MLHQHIQRLVTLTGFVLVVIVIAWALART